MKFCSLASGSSGNSYVIHSGSTTLLVDCGISGKKTFEGLDRLGLHLEDLNAICITHEHIDHIRSLRITTKKCRAAMVYSNLGTWQHFEDKVPQERQMIFRSGERFAIGDIEVQTFPISHDAADPVGYAFRADGRQAVIVTDTGRVTPEIYEVMRNADLIALEANHDVSVLKAGRYPYHLKKRILSDSGHLSNEAAADCLCRLSEDSDRRRRVLLAHLSKENNTPELAAVTVRNVLENHGILTGGRLQLDVVTRDHVSPVYQV